ncbi:hypothetical protein LSH36_418g02098 [Paralvinella palmiformis]|uniref:Uncharacterized protein n=1 Tax=Paralvinella palmiformis TaxID=53620 RepID=A0AAD9JBQ1_9ANNE|nr:hypothetical protein LSH36_418g02098 [Paralvinella palmiformis]
MAKMASILIRRGGPVLQMFYDRFPSKVLLCRIPEVVNDNCTLHRQVRHVVSIVSPPSKTKKTVLPHGRVADYPKEKYIPIMRRSLVRHLLEEGNFLTKEELQKFDSFTLSLDSAILNKYHNVLQQLKLLFDPINPDKDTVVTRSLNRKERLDNEFWLLQKLAVILEKANFRELPRSEVERALSEHQTRDGVMVSVEVNKYDVIRYWVLGRENPVEEPTLVEQLISAISQRPLPKTGNEYYKQVIVAVRLKRDDKLMLKAFKEVPISALEQLLPGWQSQNAKI